MFLFSKAWRWVLQPAFKMVPMIAASCFHTLCSPPATWFQAQAHQFEWPITYGRSTTLLLKSGSKKRLWLPPLSLPASLPPSLPPLLSLPQAPFSSLGSEGSKSYKEAHMSGNWASGRQPARNQNLPTNKSKLEAVPPAPLRLWDNCPASSLPAAWGETLAQNHPAKPLPNSGPSETAWDSQCFAL